MPEYRRAYVPGGTYFLTIATHLRRPILGPEENVRALRTAMKQVMNETPFQIPAAVILPDHVHFLWTLPRGDTNYSGRVGRMKILFTRSMRTCHETSEKVSLSRERHRESHFWQRRFWEHVVSDEEQFEQSLNYIHYNPVKHQHVTCPHLWPYSSFRNWVASGLYLKEWGCSCDNRSWVIPETLQHFAEAGE